MKLSKYNIVVSRNDRVIIFNTFRNTYTLLSKDFCQMLLDNSCLDYLQKYPNKLYDKLYRGGIIIDDDVDEYQYLVKEYEKEVLESSVYNLTILPSLDCNLRCWYCYEKHIKGSHLNLEIQDKIVKHVEAVFEKNTSLECLNVEMYGGEPLLVQNRKIISYIIDRGKRLGFTFSAITNGYDLVAYEDLLSPDGIAFLQITVDGVRDHHNSRRIHCQGFPTFDRILDNIGLALKRGVRVSVRVNTDRENIEDLKELQAIFERLQYVENPLFSMNSALLVDYSESETDNTYHYLTQREFIQKHSVSKSQFEYQDYGVFDKLYQAIMRKKPLSFHPIFCRAQTGSFVFDPYGNIYPCWEVVGRPEHCIGHYASAGGVSWSQEPLDNWHKAHISEIQACTVCKYALLCGCGCPAHNLKRHHCLRMEDIVRYAVNKAYADLQLNN